MMDDLREKPDEQATSPPAHARVMDAVYDPIADFVKTIRLDLNVRIPG